MRSLAVSNISDYQKKIANESIQGHRDFIQTQLTKARAATDAAERSACLANVIAANGLLLRGMELGFISGKPNFKAISDISRGIQATDSFQSLMEDSGERLAREGNVDGLVLALQDRDRKLSAQELPSRPAIEVIRGIQAKVRARTAQERDYAALAAAHRLSSWQGKETAPDGKLVDVVRRDLNRQLSGEELSGETERVLKDPDFQYLMKHEKRESLSVSALRLNGAALGQYAKRTEQLRQRETEHAAPAKQSGPRQG